MNAARTPRQEYGADSLEVLRGLDPVRRRPGMYTSTARPNHLAQEVLDNSVDEALAGHCDTIGVTLHQDGSLSVIDNGRGMPADVHAETGLSGIELILTRLHAGAKFSRGQYRFSGGLHGVGVSVVNALSKRLDVHVNRDGRRYRMTFAGGERSYEGRAPNKPQPAEIVDTVAKKATGTELRFWPDEKYFDKAAFDRKDLRRVLRSKALLCPGLKLRFTDRTGKEEKTQTWEYADGLPEYLRQRLADSEAVLEQPLRVGDETQEGFAIDCVVQWTPPGSGAERCQESFVNLVPTAHGGTHVNGLQAGLIGALREFVEFHKLAPKGVSLKIADIRDGLHFVLSVKLAEPQFAGQTKESLASSECVGLVKDAVKAKMAIWLNFNSEAGNRLAQHALAAAAKRLKAQRKTPRRTAVSGPALPGKLADCISSVAADCEVFLVEGDSAGGSARQARDRRYQAILPLRGKILNTWEADADKALESREIHDITVALGIRPDSDDLSRLRYHRICILADADSDGLHIATLICGLFARHFPALIEQGHVYVAQPPLYRIDVGKETHYALTDADLARLQKRFGKRKASVTRFKGLGEMSAVQLRDTVMRPRSRRLLQLTMEEGDGSGDMFDMLLAKKRAADRRAWLESSGHLSGGASAAPAPAG